MSELEAFRSEIRRFVETCAPAALRGTRKGRFDGYWGGQKAEPAPEVKRWFDAALERGLTAPRWPKTFGGAELCEAEARVFDEELARLKLPPPLVGVGLTMIGPTLLDYGTPAQRAEHLPRIVRGEVRWCQGYSEPGAGSDLASLSTRAVRDGDSFVVDGQKVWTSFADVSDWIFALGAHRSQGEETARHHVLADRHGRGRRVDATDRADQRRVAVLRDVLRRRARAGRERDRRGERRLDRRQGAARL